MKREGQDFVLSLISEGAEEADVEEAMRQFTEHYTDFGKSRREEVRFHLKQLERRLVPTPTTKLCLWVWLILGFHFILYFVLVLPGYAT